MKSSNYTLKDFELSTGLSVTERANEFQKYMSQLNELGCKSYWIESQSGVASRMSIEQGRNVVAFIANDYLGMSQREDTT